jgi:hypothetical protein
MPEYTVIVSDKALKTFIRFKQDIEKSNLTNSLSDPTTASGLLNLWFAGQYTFINNSFTFSLSSRERSQSEKEELYNLKYQCDLLMMQELLKQSLQKDEK